MKRGKHTNDEAFSLINLRNSNTEVEHTKTLCELDQMLGNFFRLLRKSFLLETLIYF